MNPAVAQQPYAGHTYAIIQPSVVVVGGCPACRWGWTHSQHTPTHTPRYQAADKSRWTPITWCFPGRRSKWAALTHLDTGYFCSRVSRWAFDRRGRRQLTSRSAACVAVCFTKVGSFDTAVCSVVIWTWLWVFCELAFVPFDCAWVNILSVTWVQAQTCDSAARGQRLLQSRDSQEEIRLSSAAQQPFTLFMTVQPVV